MRHDWIMVSVTNLEQMVPCAAGIVLGTRYYQDRIFDPNKGADTAGIACSAFCNVFLPFSLHWKLMGTPESKAAPWTEAATLDAKLTGASSLNVSLVLTVIWFVCNEKGLILHFTGLTYHLQQSLCAKAASQK